MPFPLQQFLFRIPHHLYGTNACSIGVSVPHPLAARMAELLRRTLQIAKWLWRCAFQRTFAALFLQTFLCVAAHVCRAVAKSREGRILPRAGAFRRYPVTGTEVFCFRLMAGCERAWQGPLLRGIGGLRRVGFAGRGWQLYHNTGASSGTRIIYRIFTFYDF